VEAAERLGRYRLLQKLGRGAMGVVYRAEDATTGAQVALKVMAAELSADPELMERFRREAQTASQVSHPNITRVYDFGQADERLYMAMELLDGSDLKTLIERAELPTLRDKLAVMTQVASGMALVHDRGLFHRDLKPANIHVNSNGQAKIMDFGLVRLSDSDMTRTGMVMGSPSYMAPELIRGLKADARSDVFGLGAVFYELLSGRRAFGGKGITQIIMAIIQSEPEPLSACAVDVPAPVARIAERSLRKAPEERYQTAGELHAALDVALDVYGAA
jgi:eukaryotic-like serine/threonine-protein kinase